MKLCVKVVPNSSQTRIAGWLGEELKVRIQAPPEDGRVNKALCRFLEEGLRLPSGSVAVIGGHSSPRKILEISGIDSTGFHERVGMLS